MKKIPSKVRSLIRASNQLNNHCRAVEELVYNSLDAGASSIAIRVDIQQNTIQVIDNGSGISSYDFKLVGHKYMSSKCVDLTTLKSVPNKYGFQGQALSSLIDISRSLKVVSRHEDSQETWVKLFELGQEKQLKKCNTRPSKGTTVEVAGFLYNLNIQNKSKDILYTLQSIKTFLEHISLVHCNVSLSLRDDSKNEIVFKIHKNRDVPQTLSTLYNIERNKLQELQVEKNAYKVTAYLSKSDYEAGKHFIFLNGKFILKPSKLHKIVNNNLSKYMKQRCVPKSKIKEKLIEESLIQKNIPDYCIFLKCPYADYELSNSPKQSVLEFKDWERIQKLFDKLIKFFNGDMKLKKVNNVVENNANKQQNTNTREQVKKIMERILGTNPKKTGTMNIHNGIKGKQVKRKSKETSKKATVGINKNEPGAKSMNNHETEDNLNNQNHFDIIAKTNHDCINSHGQSTDENIGPKRYSKVNVTKANLRSSVGKKYNRHFKKIPNKERSDLHKLEMKQTSIDKKISKNKSRHKQDLLLRKRKVTESIKERCDKLHRNTMLMLHQMHKNIMNESYERNNMDKNCINVTVRKQIVIHNKPKQIKPDRVNAKTKLIQSNYDLLRTILQSQRDSKSVQTRNVREEINRNIADEMNNEISYGYQKDSERYPSATKIPEIGVHKTKYQKSENKHTEPTITYESHNYYARQSIHTENNTSYHSHVQIHNEKRTFITKKSRDNFIMPNEGPKRNNFKNKHVRSRMSTPIQTHIKNLFKKTSKLFNLKKKMLGATCESSYTIEVTETNRFRSSDKAVISNLSQNARTNTEEIRLQSINYNSAANDNDVIAINSCTIELPNIDNNGYSIPDEGFCNWNFHGTYTIEKNVQIISNSDSQGQNTKINESTENNKHFIFVSKSQEHDEYCEPIDPINVCETVLSSEEMIDREFEMSFGNRANRPKNNDKGNAQDVSMFNDLSTKENEKVRDILVGHDHNDDCQNITRVSHHFDRPNNQIPVDDAVDFNELNYVMATEVNLNNNQMQEVDKSKENQTNIGDFNIINRPCFLPKGLSPILQNCKTKNECEYNTSKDYYEKELYNNFAENVRNNAEVFEPKIQGVREVTTKAIDKVNIKLVKDKSALKFDGESLYDAKVLRQIDDKFIAATMKEKGNNESDYLVLFDQHAVHERIRLENNLEDYFKENQWKGAPIDAVTLKLCNDDLLYLHNFKEKFEQLGLQWTMINYDVISINSIPEAILGKNPRQVEKVIKAVRSLITEEINILKMQGGCVSLYPKSIMDLVFSEACRYAIKFGDKLSKAECMEMIKTISGCKTPFQCAHGRPVMAVVMEIKHSRVDYKININRVLEWKKNKLFIK